MRVMSAEMFDAGIRLRMMEQRQHQQTQLMDVLGMGKVVSSFGPSESRRR